MRARTLITLGLAAVAVVAAAKTADLVGAEELVTPPARAMPATINEKLAQVTIVAVRPNIPGYDRSCSPGHGCVFGPSWSDDHAGIGGRDGCDTRNNVLAAQLDDDQFKPNTHDCVVLTANGTDRYTGKPLAFRKTNPLAVQVDHIYPLAAAWDMGASKWTKQRRVDFANDQVRELLVVSGSANRDKSDKTPADWLVPDNPGYRCTFIVKYLTVADDYDLPISRADAAAIKRAAKDC